MDRRTAYLLFGLALALCAVLMAFAPRSELMFIVFTSLHAFIVGLTYAGFTAVVLEAIGKGAAATKYNLFASLSNMPIAFVTYLDGEAHSRWGSEAMLLVDAGTGVVGVLLFAAIALATRRRVAATTG